MALALALDIAKNAAAAAGLEQPATLNRGDGLQVRALLNRGGRALAEKRGTFGESWPELTHELQLNLTAGQDFYALPPGFASIVIDTAWTSDGLWPALGPVSPSEWRALKGRIAGHTAPSLFYRIMLNPGTGQPAIRIHPVPTGPDVVTMEYVSDHWVKPSLTSAPSSSSVDSDAHVPVFLDELMILDLEWRLRAADGLAFDAQLGEFEMRRDRVFSQLTGDSARTINMATRKRTGANVQVVNYTGIGDGGAPSSRTTSGTTPDQGREFSQEFSQEFD